MQALRAALRELLERRHHVDSFVMDQGVHRYDMIKLTKTCIEHIASHPKNPPLAGHECGALFCQFNQLAR